MKSFNQRKIKSQKNAAILLIMAATFLLFSAFEKNPQFENVNTNIQMASAAVIMCCGIFALRRSINKQNVIKGTL